MNLVLMSTLAFAAAVEGRIAAPHSLLGAEQLAFLELGEPCAFRGCAADYCYPINGVATDFNCYKHGYPKCCTKDKGNCPSDHKPECECEPGVCGNSLDTRTKRCTTGDGTCEGNTFCNAEDGTCGSSGGRCAAMPDKCAKNLMPVCGCNGVTYDNECQALAHGVSVASDHACGHAPLAPVETDDCTLDGNECGTNEFCAVAESQCLLKMAGIPGKCQPLRGMCGLSHAPVCGCDGATYSNADCANARGVNVAHHGECVSTDDCTLDGNECGTNEFCAVDEGKCLLKMAGIPGKCRPLRAMCNLSHGPVCGCDGTTYSNADCANAQGANVAHHGECVYKDCNYYGVKRDDCSSGDEFCRIGIGDCKFTGASQPGRCAAKPLECPYDYAPVCGCDSNTYANECVALLEQVNVMYEGTC